MLQQEFFEQTGVNLTPEEYAKVEHIYNCVLMDKYEFCKQWLKNRDNQIISELMMTISKLENDCQELVASNKSLMEESETISRQKEHELNDITTKYKDRMESFGRKIVISGSDQTDLYDALEEEFGLDFIVKIKLEEDLPLETFEREHLIKKI